MQNPSRMNDRPVESRISIQCTDTARMTELSIFTDEDLAEFDAEAYYAASEALEAAERASKAKGITRAEIARRLRMDKGSVTRVMGGSQRNITMKTLFALMRAMNRKVFITSCSIDELDAKKSNFFFDHSTIEAPTITVYSQRPNVNDSTVTVFVSGPM